jgi:hypothetical protein
MCSTDPVEAEASAPTRETINEAGGDLAHELARLYVDQPDDLDAVRDHARRTVEKAVELFDGDLNRQMTFVLAVRETAWAGIEGGLIALEDAIHAAEAEANEPQEATVDAG